MPIYYYLYPEPLPAFVNWLASNSVSRSIKMSPIWIGPFMFRLNILFLSLPSKTLHLTWIASPLVPVLPITSSTFAGVANEKLTAPFTCSSCCCCRGAFLFIWPRVSSFKCFVGSSLAILFSYFFTYFLYQLLCFSFLDYNNASSWNFNACSYSKLFFARYLYAWYSFFFCKNWDVHCNFWWVNIFCYNNKLSCSFFNYLSCFICAFSYFSSSFSHFYSF